MSENKLTAELKLPQGNKLVLSSSPHISAGDNVRKIMYKMLIALLPAMAAAVWFWGIRALFLIVFTAICCVGAEALWCKLTGKPVLGTIRDGSAVVTGVLLAMNLSAAVPWYLPVIGAFLAIWLGKQIYGGLGCNPFNPAIVARVGLLIAFPAAMTCWIPGRGMTEAPERDLYFTGATTRTCATPMGLAESVSYAPQDKAAAMMAEIDSPQLWKSYFLGRKSGSMGEAFAPALLIGLAILLIFRLINWQVPVFFLGTVALITFLCNLYDPLLTPGPVFHLLTGGLLFGAVFMATDMVTSPVTPQGAAAFGIGCGLVTAVIRIWGNYPDGVSFAILFMNATVPLLDRWFGKKPFGYALKRKPEEV